jgi:hypothetical protein
MGQAITYKLVRMFADGSAPVVLETGLSLAVVQEYCKDPCSSSRTADDEEARELTERFGDWFDGYEEE